MEGERNLDREGGPAAWHTLHAHRAVDQTDEAAGDGEAKAGAAILARDSGVGLDELVEYSGGLHCSHADASVRDGHHKGSAARVEGLFGAESNVAVLGEFGGVGQQIDEGLFELLSIRGETDVGTFEFKM